MEPLMKEAIKVAGPSPAGRTTWYLTGLESPVSSNRRFVEEVRCIQHTDARDEYGYEILVFDRYDSIGEMWYADQAPEWKLFHVHADQPQ